MPKKLSDGNIRKRPDGRWEARYSAGIDPGTGKYIQRSLYANSEKEIKSKLREAIASLEQGVDICTRISFGAWLKQWMDEYKTNDLRPTTYKCYSDVIKNHLTPKLGAINLQSMNTGHIQKFLNSLQLEGSRLDGKEGSIAPSFILKIRNIIHSALEQAVLNRLITHNPCKGVVIPPILKPDIEAFTIEQQKTFMDVADKHPLRAFFLLGLSSGLRRGELLGLSWENVDFANNLIHVKQSAKRVFDRETNVSRQVLGEVKTFSSRRSVPLMGGIVPVLLQHKAEQDKLKEAFGSKWNPMNLVFCTVNGSLVEESTMRRYMNSILRAAKLPAFSMHSLRHSFATRLLDAGVSPKVVSEFLGHKDVAFTMNTYVHVTLEKGQEEIGKLDALFSAHLLLD